MVILYLVESYMILGLVFAVAFVTRLIHRVDESAAASPWTFRLLILPGCIVFWPILLNKYLTANRESSND